MRHLCFSQQNYKFDYGVWEHNASSWPRKQSKADRELDKIDLDPNERSNKGKRGPYVAPPASAPAKPTQPSPKNHPMRYIGVNREQQVGTCVGLIHKNHPMRDTGANRERQVGACVRSIDIMCDVSGFESVVPGQPTPKNVANTSLAWTIDQ